MARNLFFDPKARDQFVAMWKFVAQRMKAENHVVGYDLLTEPTWKESDSADEALFRELWRSLARRTIAVIRSVEADTPILVEPDGWASPEALKGWKPLHAMNIERQQKIVYAVHQYSPYEDTHQKDRFDPEMKKLKAVFQQLKSFQQTYDVPLAVNEFGIKFRRPGAARFLEKELELLEQHGMNHAIYIGRDWTMRGTIIRHNYLHHLHGLEKRGCEGIYLDDMASGMLLHGNVFFDVYRAFQIGGGRDVIVENNLMINCKTGVYVDARALGWAKPSIDANMKPRLDAMPIHSEVWKSRYPQLLTLWNDQPGAPKGTVVRRNVGVHSEVDAIRKAAKPFRIMARPLRIDIPDGIYHVAT